MLARWFLVSLPAPPRRAGAPSSAVGLIALLLPACAASYEGALGYRARHAALAGDAAAFDALMEEAAGVLPGSPLDNPKRTVLTHFLDLAGSDLFFPMIEAWTEKGWVPEAMTCAIHRARFRGTLERDPAEAERAAGVCVDRARAAALDGDRSWEIEACLDEAPFLTRTSTAAVWPYVELASLSTEPFGLRAGLLSGLTKLYLQDPATLRVNDPSLSREESIRRARARLDPLSARFRQIIGRLVHDSELPLLAGATAFGALELERVHLALGESLAGRYATSELPAESDLAWGWVRAMKAKKRIPRLENLGLWDRRREPAGDAYWYLCARAPVARADGTLGVEAAVVLALERSADPEALRRAHCPVLGPAEPLPSLHGPFPLAEVARGTVTASISAARGAPVSVHVARRVMPPRATKTVPNPNAVD